MDEASRFRSAAAVANQNRPRTGWRYPPELRAKAVEIFANRREPLNAVAVSLGISAISLARWLESSSSELAGFREVALAPESEVEVSRLKVTSPGVDGRSRA